MRKVGRTVRTSCWNEVLKAVSRLGLGAFFTVSRTDFTLTAKNNGAQILFCGLDDVEKVKSLTPAHGPLTDIWMEEATECAYGDFKQLSKRLRGQSRHEKRITLSMNPIYRTHWIYRAFFSDWEDGAKELEKENLYILKTTYRDNLFLSEDDRRALEEETDPYFYSVYTLGNWGVLGDVIFTGWEARDLSGLSVDRTRVRCGLDFGYAHDPSACVRTVYDRKSKTVFILGELYERGLTNAALADRLKVFAPGEAVVCDSAEPKSIRELREYGVLALPAKKGPDSVLHGIQWLQGQNIVLDKRCLHLRDELSRYAWQQDAEGNALPLPKAGDDHLLDALRYALEEESLHRTAKTGG